MSKEEATSFVKVTIVSFYCYSFFIRIISSVGPHDKIIRNRCVTFVLFHKKFN